jgi:hypothetical protein
MLSARLGSVFPMRRRYSAAMSGYAVWEKLRA